MGTGQRGGARACSFPPTGVVGGGDAAVQVSGACVLIPGTTVERQEMGGVKISILLVT